MAKKKFNPLPQKSLSEVLIDLANYEDSRFEILVNEVQSQEALDRDYTRCKAVAKKIGAESPEDAFFILNAIQFFYREVRELQEFEEEHSKIITYLLTSLRGLQEHPDERKILASRLPALIAPNVALDDIQKLDRLKIGFLPNAVGFSSFVDLRPDFSEDRNSIKRLVPVVQFRVTTDSEEPHTASFLFQLSEEGLRQMKSSVDDTSLKLKAARAHSNMSQLIVPVTDQDK